MQISWVILCVGVLLHCVVGVEYTFLQTLTASSSSEVHFPRAIAVSGSGNTLIASDSVQTCASSSCYYPNLLVYSRDATTGLFVTPPLTKYGATSSTSDSNTDYYGTVGSIATSENGTEIAVGYSSGNKIMYYYREIANNSITTTVTTTCGTVYCYDLGKYVAMNSDASLMVSYGGQLLAFTGPNLVSTGSTQYSVSCLAMNYAGTMVVTISSGGYAEYQTLKDYQFTHQQSFVIPSAGYTFSLGLGSGNLLLVGNQNYNSNAGQVTVWQLVNGTFTLFQTLNPQYLNEPLYFGYQIQLSRDDSRIFVTSLGKTYIYGYAPGDSSLTLLQTISNIGGPIGISADGSLFATSTQSGGVINVYTAPPVSTAPPPGDSSVKTLNFGAGVFGNVSSSSIPYFESHIEVQTQVVYSLSASNCCLYVARGYRPSSGSFDYKECTTGTNDFTYVNFAANVTDYYYSRVTTGASSATPYFISLVTGAKYDSLQ